MADTVMLNARMDRVLKDRGSQVLKANGISTTEYVRRAFQYLEDHQCLPECFADGGCDAYEKRRVLLRDLVGVCQNAIPQAGAGLDEARHARADEKYARYLA